MAMRASPVRIAVLTYGGKRSGRDPVSSAQTARFSYFRAGDPGLCREGTAFGVSRPKAIASPNLLDTRYKPVAIRGVPGMLYVPDLAEGVGPFTRGLANQAGEFQADHDQIAITANAD